MLTMPNIPYNSQICKKRGGQEIVTHNAEKNQSTEPDPEITKRANKQLLAIF